ncbi:MAG: Gfo/Idh/MocA family oxidoreductase [Oenococcus sp.]|uniref:Gfo/Idh/MocA family protein n=1 Tax=Oenococcus sp. TaxID=1979414 RepID=UPI0039E8761E
MPQTYHWAIVGLGHIAESFAKAFQSDEGQLYAVCSRSIEKAETFAAAHKIPKAYGSLDDLLADPVVDIVYVATPHNFHIQTILPALKAGKHVLSEKAITMTSSELASAVDLADKQQLVLAEAMTVYHMPLYAKLHQFAKDHQLGGLKMIQVSFGSYKEADPSNRFFNPQLAGGALLDIGVYALAFAAEFLKGRPQMTGTSMHRFISGVDESSTIALRTDQDELANLSLTFRAKMPKMGIAAYEHGYLTVTDFPRANQAVFTSTDGSTELIKAGDSKLAMAYEIHDFQEMVAGRESNHSLKKTETVMRLMTEVRNQWDFRYPFEK